MISVPTLSDKNFLIYAVKAYSNPNGSSTEDFQQDLNRIICIKRQLNKYVKCGRIKERVLLNHFIILGNVFSPEHAVRLLFFKCDPIVFPALKTFFLLLGWMPEVVIGIDPPIISSDIPVDLELANILRKFSK